MFASMFEWFRLVRLSLPVKGLVEGLHGPGRSQCLMSRIGTSTYIAGMAFENGAELEVLRRHVSRLQRFRAIDTRSDRV